MDRANWQYPLLNQNMDDVGRLPSSSCPKVFIQRDYQDGCNVRFQKKFPQELEGQIERAAFENTIDQLNTLYSEAEALTGRTYCESCFACLTAYLAYLCMTTQYEKTLKKIERYIRSQNEDVYHPRGLHLIDPVQRGLRVLEICIVSEASPR